MIWVLQVLSQTEFVEFHQRKFIKISQLHLFNVRQNFQWFHWKLWISNLTKFLQTTNI